tara:strand:+ start:240 stop:686 length:447 start_codon:yes stop_codon:yes gene_type:complete
MASTLTPSTFNVKIIEEQVVKSNTIKNQTTFTINSVTNVDRRTVTCPTASFVTLFNLNGLTPGAGTFPSSSLKYARISNLDDTNNLAITISGSNGRISQEVTPKSTILIASSNITSSIFAGTFGDDIQFVQAYAIGGDIDVDYTIVNS